MKRIASICMIGLIMLSTLPLALNLRPVSATGTIYIRADGSIDPPTAPIMTADNITYLFTANISDHVVVERNHITVDGSDHTIQGAGSGDGITLAGRINVTIRHVKVQNFENGIYIAGSFYNNVSENTIQANSRIGIGLWSSQYNHVMGNTITDNTYISGVWLCDSSNNSIAGNYVRNNTVTFRFSSSNTLSDNYFLDGGFFADESYDSLVAGNFVNGKPLVYLERASDVTIDGEAGQVILVGCNRIRVEGLNLTNAYWGVELFETNSTDLVGNNVTDNTYGIFFHSSYCNTILGNNIQKNQWAGVFFDFSNNNTISNNKVRNNNRGVFFQRSSNNSISANSVESNGLGIGLYSSISPSSNDNTVLQNNITNNGQGIWLDSSVSGNKFFHNNIMDNIWAVNINLPSASAWDNGYPAGGNYWGYSMVDSYKGQYQNETGSDGVGDHPRVFDESNQDRYPLTKLFGGPAGDVDGDDDVDIFDIVKMASIYGVTYPDPRYNRLCDMDLDGDIDIFDVIAAAGNFGKHW